MKAWIVDDEAPAREELAWLLEQCDGVEVAGQCASASEAKEMFDAGGQGVDLLFLDIDMPGIDGMRLAEFLHEKRQKNRPQIVFVTAYDDHAVEAFEVDAVDYVLKPVRLERLQKAVARAETRLQESSSPGEEAGERTLERISVEDRGVYRVVPVDDILYFEADGGVVVAATQSERYITDFRLGFLEERLPDETFFRCHRSYIVRLDAIESIAPWGAGTYRLILSREEDVGVPLARSRADELKSLIPWSARVVE